ncbi:arylsulfatase J-like [Ylistrum balloti]|uniref:arylsulfatase J-like n=1 Tax=Ylistrum balloti TaxID=509963 RepID=UPI002905C4C8|nr:arylsulfatase J-like [Ylistrum balloti]
MGICKTTSRPHIIVVVADDLGWNDVSFHGSSQIPTPNIDSLAYRGIILNNYYVSPLCTPTRGALMSGLHPIHTGLHSGVIRGAQPNGLPLNITIMPQRLRNLGYRTHIVGKWHLGSFKSEYTPTYRGFETFTGYYNSHGDYYDHTYEDSEGFFGYDFRSNVSLDYTAIGQYSTTLFTERAVDIVKQHNREEPLFLYLPYQAVHTGNVPSGNPLQAPSAYINRHPHIRSAERRHYAGMVAALDDGVADVVDALKTRDMYKDSIILFTTDNGGSSNGYMEGAGNNFPLRGMKNTLWEGGVRGVAFINSPLLDTTGYVSENLIHVCDWLPTLYSAAGGDPTDLGDTDGLDIWKMLSTNGEPVRNEILHNLEPYGSTGAIRVGDYKLVVLHNDATDMANWYPPYHTLDDSTKLHFSKFETGAAMFHLFLRDISRRKTTGKCRHCPISVECGQKYDYYRFNNNEVDRINLFHIPSDPCNRTADTSSNPKLHGGAWVPWLD